MTFHDLNDVAKKENIKTVDDLLCRHPEFANTFDEDKNSYLHIAAREGNAQLALLLLKKGANYQILNNRNELPIQTALSTGHTDVSQLLIDWPDYIRCRYIQTHRLNCSLLFIGSTSLADDYDYVPSDTIETVHYLGGQYRRYENALKEKMLNNIQ